jgi:hypothetical protein
MSAESISFLDRLGQADLVLSDEDLQGYRWRGPVFQAAWLVNCNFIEADYREILESEQWTVVMPDSNLTWMTGRIRCRPRIRDAAATNDDDCLKIDVELQLSRELPPSPRLDISIGEHHYN